MLSIVADRLLAQLALFEELGNVIALPAQALTPVTIKNADVLLVRTETQVNAELLTGSTVRFVGTATAGIDHIDTAWLTANKIVWAQAAGCNAEAVAEYVLSCLAALRVSGRLAASNLRIGIIGAGQVGQCVTHYLQALGFEVLCNDPLRALRDPTFQSVDLSEFVNLDVIAIHAALHKQAPFPSYHLLTADFLQRQKTNCVLINAARGAIIDGASLIQAGKHLIWCFDVWEREPAINLELVEQAAIATPHIAGYTAQAKINATQLIYKALKAWSIDQLESLTKEEIQEPKNRLTKVLINKDNWEQAMLALYDVRKDSESMKAALLFASQQPTAAQFLALRAQYKWR